MEVRRIAPNKSLSTLEVAELLHVSKSTIYELIRRGDIYSYKVGRKVRFTQDDVDAYIARSRHEQSVQPVKRIEIHSALLEKEDHYGGMARNFRRCIEPYRIPVLYRTMVTAICGHGRITGVKLRRLDSGEEKQISCDTLITALGLIPERELVRGLGKPDWLFLAGNCSRVHELVDSAAAEAERIGKEAST